MKLKICATLLLTLIFFTGCTNESPRPTVKISFQDGEASKIQIIHKEFAKEYINKEYGFRLILPGNVFIQESEDDLNGNVIIAKFYLENRMEELSIYKEDRFDPEMLVDPSKRDGYWLFYEDVKIVDIDGRRWYEGGDTTTFEEFASYHYITKVQDKYLRVSFDACVQGKDPDCDSNMMQYKNQILKNFQEIANQK